MRILHICTFDGNVGGGTRSAQRIHDSQRMAGHDSHFLVQKKVLNDKTIHEVPSSLLTLHPQLRAVLDALPLLMYPKWDRKGFWPQRIPNLLLKQSIEKLEPDIINLHWITRGFMPIELIGTLDVPVVWTIHDMWAFTGGCYYSGDCYRYQQQCGSCFKLGSQNPRDLSFKILERKRNAWSTANLNIVSPSNWLAQAALDSSLFQKKRVDIIPYPIDVSTFRRRNKDDVRKELNLPCDKALLLFGAKDVGDERKGFHLLKQAISLLDGHHHKLELVVFGNAEPVLFEDIELKVHYLGSVTDDVTLAKIYSAADIYIACSLEDNLPNTVIEASCCGTPCVAFKIGGLPDLISHKVSGYLAVPFSPQDLAKGIMWCVDGMGVKDGLPEATHAAATNKFAPEVVARQYAELYLQILSLN